MRTVVKEELEPPRRDRIRVKNKTYPLPETIDRLEAVLQAKNITIFIRIDQQAEAEKVGLSLRPTQLLLFGNPQAGTPLMVAEPTIALDLPTHFLKLSALT